MRSSNPVMAGASAATVPPAGEIGAASSFDARIRGSGGPEEVTERGRGIASKQAVTSAVIRESLCVWFCTTRCVRDAAARSLLRRRARGGRCALPASFILEVHYRFQRIAGRPARRRTSAPPPPAGGGAARSLDEHAPMWLVYSLRRSLRSCAGTNNSKKSVHVVLFQGSISRPACLSRRLAAGCESTKRRCWQHFWSATVTSQRGFNHAVLFAVVRARHEIRRQPARHDTGHRCKG